jgi:hypothetical protein
MPMKFSSLAPALVGAVSVLVASSGAQAVESKRGNPQLKQYCTGDYLTYCGNLAPDDPATDRCMQTNWAKLSENCRRAIDAYDPKASRKRG